MDIFAAASQLGVGYDTLLKHLRFSLNLIDHARMVDLAAIQPKEIRRMILGESNSGHLVLADNHWEGVAIDLEVGDFAVIPFQLRILGNSVREVGQCANGIILEGVRPGLAQAQSNHTDWASMIRVSKKQFTGRGAYRHLEDPDYE